MYKLFIYIPSELVSENDFEDDLLLVQIGNKFSRWKINAFVSSLNTRDA
jgi:hypothetical protein